MLEGLLSSDAIRPRSLEAYAGSVSRSQEVSARSLTAASGEGDDRQTRITLSERAFSELRESRVAFARTGGNDEAEDFARGIDRASRRIGRALERFVDRVERLQDRAEALGERLTQRIRDDIAEGRFDDRTTDRLATKLLSQAGRLERAAERLTDRLESAFERAGAPEGAALNVSFSQSISVSVQQVQIEIQDGDNAVSVSYQKLVFESTTTLGISFAQGTPQVADPANPDGASLPTAEQESGTFVNAEAEQAAAIAEAVSGDDDLDGGEGAGDDLDGGEGAAAVPQDGPSALTAGQGALLLIQQVSFEASVTRFSFDAAARTGPFGGFGAEFQASRFDFSQQSTRLLALTA